MDVLYSVVFKTHLIRYEIEHSHNFLEGYFKTQQIWMFYNPSFSFVFHTNLIFKVRGVLVLWREEGQSLAALGLTNLSCQCVAHYLPTLPFYSWEMHGSLQEEMHLIFPCAAQTRELICVSMETDPI